MRPIHGAAPGASAADHFIAMRDNPSLARPANPSEAVATDDLHVFAAPSRAHVKRIKRAGIGNIPKPREYPAPSEDVLTRRAQLDFHKRVIAQLGGSMTIVGVQEPRQERRAPGVCAPLTDEQLALRAEQREAEAERLAYFHDRQMRELV